jgi:hypothetical protein
MKVKCIANDYAHLTERSKKAGRDLNVIFHVNIGDTYCVYGINLWRRGTLSYLVMNAAGSMPIWVPAELFQLVDGKLPNEWYYKFLGLTDDYLNAVWGYKELVENPKHYTGLVGEDKKEIDLFMQKKKEIDAVCK